MKRPILAALFVALTVPFLALNAKEPSIRTDKAYLAAVETVNANYHLATTYGGPSSVWTNLAEKLEGLLAIEDRAGKAVTKNLREMIAMACFLDMMALEIRDRKTHPLSGKKLTPVDGMADFKRRVFALEVLKGQNVERTMNGVLRGPILWPSYGRFRNAVNGHDSWATLLPQLPEPVTDKKRIQRADPFWGYFAAAVPHAGLPDRFPEIETATDKREIGNFDLSGKDKTSVRIDLKAIDTSFDYRCTVKANEDLHVAIEAEQGSFRVVCIDRVAWSRVTTGDDRQPSGFTMPTKRPITRHFTLSRRDIPHFPALNKATTGQVIIWTGDKDKPPRPDKADVVLSR